MELRALSDQKDRVSSGPNVIIRVLRMERAWQGRSLEEKLE